MTNKKIIISNAIICSVLCILGILISTINVSQTYLTASAPLANGNRNAKQVGLMFIITDPQLANNLTPILTTLEKAQASATFFFTGTSAINNLELLQTISQKHELGNYGFSNIELNIADKNERREFDYHKQILNGTLPLTIGGGIGQSRVCMLLLGKLHIGEVQASLWSDEMIKTCAEKNVNLL